MTMMTPLALVFATMVAQGPAAVTAADDLAAVKDLYASASFDEALQRLSSADNRLGKAQTEEYRALCLLGLGRTAEARAAFDRAIALANSAAEAAHIRQHLDRLDREASPSSQVVAS